MRKALSLLVVLPVLLTAAPAYATGCPLLLDPAGDARHLGAPANVPSLDVLSADVASGATEVVGVLRLAAPADLLSGRAGRWTVAWDMGTTTYTFSLRATVAGGLVTDFQHNGTSAPVVTVVNVATGEITWTAPRAGLPDFAVPGGTFTDLRALTSLAGGSVDVALVAGPVYVDQDPGCVPAV